MTAVQTSFFDGKCAAYIEGYCHEPEEGKFYPWRNHSELAAAQAQYEKDLADRAELEEAFNYLLNGGTPYELHG
jgi:hypothetical protein